MLRGNGPTRSAARVVVLLALLLAVFVILRLNTQPGLAVALYGLLPVVLGVFWFSLIGGVLAATGAMLAFFIDHVITPSDPLQGADLWWAGVNRAIVFYGVAVLVTFLLRRERRLAGQVEAQRVELAELESLRAALTPSEVPPRPGLHLAASFHPADGEVAGDFFLVVEGPDDSTTIVVGDVVGHGLEAARCAAFVRAALATFARFSSDPAQLLKLADTALAEQRGQVNSFVTAVCLNISRPPDAEIRWAAAGHQAPWYLDTAGSLPGGRPGMPLGIGTGELRVEAGQVPLEPGSGVLMFTDGLTEGRAARRSGVRGVELFGEERARQILRERAGAPVERIVEALVSEVTTFAQGPLADDLCLVAVRAQPADDRSSGLAA